MESNLNLHENNPSYHYLDIPNLWLRNALIWVEKLDKRALIFILLAFNWASFSLINNEEMYFGLAKQFVNPEWIKGSFLFTEFAGTRLLFQWISGFWLQFLSFEQFCMVGRLFNFALYALAFALIFKELKFSNLGILFLFAFLWRKQQTFFAHEWLFLGFEAKTLAYVFVFLAIYLLLKERWFWAVGATVIATYFHILVGGWFFLVLFVYHFISEKSIVESFKVGLLFTVLIAPWIYYLAKDALLFPMDANTKAMLDNLYVFERAPHHVGIFKSWEYFSKNALQGFILSLIGFGSIIWRFRKEEGAYKKLSLLTILIYILLYLGCLAALSQHAGFLKFYPFRIAALAFLLSTILLLKPISELLLFLKIKRWLPALLLLLGLGYALDNLKRNIISMQRDTTLIDSLADFSKTNTSKDAVFMFYGFGTNYERGECSFYRKAERDGWLDYKFVPSGGAKMLEWSIRVNEADKLEADINYLDQLQTKYKIDYVISSKALEKPYLKQVFKNEKYLLYAIQ